MESMWTINSMVMKTCNLCRGFKSEVWNNQASPIFALGIDRESGFQLIKIYA